MRFKIFLFILFLCLCCLSETAADKPCAAVRVEKKSVVCVCNATYCDTITRIPPTHNTYVTYISSESGMRFNKTIQNLGNVRRNLNNFDINCEEETLVLHPDIKYQTIQGFGGAVTDSAGLNWKNLSEPLQQLLIQSYFSEEGLQYNMIRVPIGGTDFSTHPYAYNDYPKNDNQLSNYTLTDEDYHYKIPMIKAAMQASKTQILIVASTWSPPPWMKTNNNYTGNNRLKPEYYQLYAVYHLKFLEKYLGEGIKIWAITTTNEPTNALIGLCSHINCLGWSAHDMGNWIVNNLGPTIRNSTFNDVLILAGDDQRITIPYWMNLMVAEHPTALNYINGVAVHYYTDFISPPVLLTQLQKFYPDKFIIGTEGCQGSMWFEKHHVDLGSWKRGESYVQDIITDLNYGMVGWIDWNMCLNRHGGPTWTGNYVDSPIIVFPKKGEFVKQPMFYAMGHFSKFIPRGSRRIEVTAPLCWKNSIQHVAFITPDNTTVMVLYNSGGDKKVNIKIGEKLAVVNMPVHSFATVELSY